MEQFCNLDPTKMSVAELREALEPYGTMHRRTMKKADLIRTVQSMQRNYRIHGGPAAPTGYYADEHPEDRDK